MTKVMKSNSNLFLVPLYFHSYLFSTPRSNFDFLLHSPLHQAHTMLLNLIDNKKTDYENIFTLLGPNYSLACLRWSLCFVIDAWFHITVWSFFRYDITRMTFEIVFKHFVIETVVGWFVCKQKFWKSVFWFLVYFCSAAI